MLLPTGFLEFSNSSSSSCLHLRYISFLLLSDLFLGARGIFRTNFFNDLEIILFIVLNPCLLYIPRILPPPIGNLLILLNFSCMCGNHDRLINLAGDLGLRSLAFKFMICKTG